MKNTITILLIFLSISATGAKAVAEGDRSEKKFNYNLDEIRTSILEVIGSEAGYQGGSLKLSETDIGYSISYGLKNYSYYKNFPSIIRAAHTDHSAQAHIGMTSSTHTVSISTIISNGDTDIPVTVEVNYDLTDGTTYTSVGPTSWIYTGQMLLTEIAAATVVPIFLISTYKFFKR
jgi:hypothetical protein